MSTKPAWIDWGEYQVICCTRCKANYDLKKLPSALKNPRYDSFIAAHSLCFPSYVDAPAHAMTVLQRTAVDIYSRLVATNQDSELSELADQSLAAAREICDALARCER
jgi:hypothetical protein